MNMDPRPTAITLNLGCPRCSSRLSLLAGRAQLTFHCGSGHTFPMRQLFQAHRQDVNRGLRAVLDLWLEKAVVFRGVAERARTEGRLELAETFLLQEKQLGERIGKLREHLKGLPEDSANGSSAAG